MNSSLRPFRIASRLGLATVVLMFGLIVLGSVVRTTGSGLACPDWPLCEGRLIPRFQFNVMIEWTHRLVALVVSLLLAGTVVWVLAHAALRRRLGGLMLLSVLLLAAQVLLGALTVWKLLHPSVVSSHLAVALLLFVTFLVFTLAAHGESRPAPPAPDPSTSALAPWFAIAAVLTYAQAVLGGVVSTSHASLACPDWPTCRGEWFPAMTGLVGLQVAHRYGAYLLLAFVLVLSVRARAAGDLVVRALGRLAFTLTLGQAALGVINVLLGVPVWVSALHLGVAALLVSLHVVSAFRAAERHAAPVAAEAR